MEKKVDVTSKVEAKLENANTGLLAAFSQLSLYFSEIKWVPLFSFGLLGLALGFFFPITATIFQTRIPKQYHGRFFSFKSMLDRVMFQVVLLATGLFLDTIGFHYMVIVFGIISLCLIAFFVFRHTDNDEAIIQEQKSTTVS